MRQVTKDQHFVPKFYLKRFANEKGFVEVLDIEKKRITKPKPYAGVCYDRYFYAAETGIADEVSQEYEKMFTVLEGEVSKNWDSILENARNKRLTESDFDLLSWFMSMQWMRTPSFREMIKSGETQMLGHITKMRVGTKNFEESYRKSAKKHGIKITTKDIEEVKTKVLNNEIRFETNNAGHLKFIPKSLEGFRNLMFNKQWNIILAPPNIRFITTDNPVAEWLPKRVGFYGTTFLERKHYLALSPRILVELTFPTRDSLAVGPQETVTYKHVGKDNILMYDIILINHGHSHSYGVRKKEFEELLRQLKNPGRASYLYFTNYHSK